MRRIAAFPPHSLRTRFSKEQLKQSGGGVAIIIFSNEIFQDASGNPKEPLNKSSAALSGSFAPTDRFGTKSPVDRSCDFIRGSLIILIKNQYQTVKNVRKRQRRQVMRRSGILRSGRRRCGAPAPACPQNRWRCHRCTARRSAYRPREGRAW